MDLLKVMADERTKLNTRLEELAKQKEELDSQMQQVKTELKAIDAYEQSKNPVKREKKARSPRKAGIKQSVMNMIASSANITRSVLIENMGAKGDKSKEQAISNALSSLKKEGKITSDAGAYSKAQ